MPRVAASEPSGERIVLFVPRWLPTSERNVGLPYRVVPVVSALTANGVDVDLVVEPHHGGLATCLPLLDGARAAVAWCPELNPAEQMPSLRTFLAGTAAARPDLPRLLGGGFVHFLPPEFGLEGLATPVHGQENGALLQAVAALAGRVVPARQPFSADALYRMDLAPFVHPAALLFANDAPSLQIPTGMGCGKACAFCFYEQTSMRLLPAAGVVELIAHCAERYGVRQFQLGELDFLASRRRALDVAAGLRAAGLAVKWFALASVQDILALGSDGLRTLAASGLAVLETGTETGTDDALRRLGKKFTVADALRAHDLLVAAGIVPVHNFVLGWPGETAADRRGLLALVDRLHRRAPRTVLHFRHYQAIPSTTFGDRVLHLHGPVPTNVSELERWRTAQERQLPWLAAADEEQVRFLAEYLLPLAYGDDLAPGRAPWLRRALRRVARLRCRTGFLRLPIDRRVFRATSERGLRVTWLG